MENEKIGGLGMTEKRFEVVMNEFDEVEYIMDKAMMEDRDFAEFIDFVEDVCKENEQLKFQLQNTSDQRDEFYRGARENANRVGKLEKENEQLKEELKELKIDNKAKDDAIDGLQSMMAHYNLEDLE